MKCTCCFIFSLGSIINNQAWAWWYGLALFAILIRLLLVIARLWWCLLFHASIFQNIGPFPASPGMAMLQVLSKMIRTEKLLCIVALPKLVHTRQMLKTAVPIGLWEVGKLIATITARVM